MKQHITPEQLKKLEERIEKLEKEKVYPPFSTTDKKPIFDPECLHSGCNHERNPMCMLSCPHCSPTC